ncbi:MAG: four helix bundle protein [Patescibacteria group bacterium]|nr:four helix bundle protein [Patescibacteria group bacterium]
MEKGIAGDDREKFKKEFARRIHNFILDLIKFIDGLDKKDSTCKIIGQNQLLRSGTSMGGNYFEAQAASSINDFVNYFRISLKSANETKFWLILLRDAGKCDRNLANNLLKELTEISSILAKSIKTIKSKK